MANPLELVFIPAPGAGHITSTIQLTKLLANRDQNLSITVLVISPPGSTPGSNPGSPVTTSTAPISFIELPQVKNPPLMFGSKTPITSFNDFITSHCEHVKNIVADKISKHGTKRLAGFVVDMFCTAMIDVANEFNVPSYVFFTSNAAFLGFYLYIKILCDDKKEDVVELSKSGSEIFVPSFANPVPTKAFWSLATTREGLAAALGSARRLRGVKGIVVNSFLELETYAIKSMSVEGVPPVYPVGPVLSLESGVGKNPVDHDVVSWLDGQPDSSVVFLCFGSRGSFDEVQVKEIARGLEKSGYRFLWSLRRPPSGESSKGFPGDYKDPGMVLPEGFLERTSGIGKVIGWAPQVTVLAHRAVGGFVSHCGWNSLLESLWFGVPSATWPIYAEQQMNAFEMVVELGLAVEISLDYKKDVFDPTAVDTVIVTAQEIERGITRVMEDKELRIKVKNICEESRAAVAEGGSSYESLGFLIQDFMKNIS